MESVQRGRNEDNQTPTSHPVSSYPAASQLSFEREVGELHRLPPRWHWVPLRKRPGEAALGWRTSRASPKSYVRQLPFAPFDQMAPYALIGQLSGFLSSDDLQIDDLQIDDLLLIICWWPAAPAANGFVKFWGPVFGVPIFPMALDSLVPRIWIRTVSMCTSVAQLAPMSGWAQRCK